MLEGKDLERRVRVWEKRIVLRWTVAEGEVAEGELAAFDYLRLDLVELLDLD